MNDHDWATVAVIVSGLALFAAWVVVGTVRQDPNPPDVPTAPAPPLGSGWMPGGGPLAVSPHIPPDDAELPRAHITQPLEPTGPDCPGVPGHRAGCPDPDCPARGERP